jgi:hypothetical protein
VCLAFAKREPRGKYLNAVKKFGIALLAGLDEVYCVRKILSGGEPTDLEPAVLIGSSSPD